MEPTDVFAESREEKRLMRVRGAGFVYDLTIQLNKGADICKGRANLHLTNLALPSTA